MQTNVNSSEYRSSVWKQRDKEWTVTQDLWESPMYIRDKATEYLDKFPKESGQKYTNRLNNSVFSNYFREAIETMAGTVFKDDPKPEEAPPAIAELFTDIDGNGNSLHQFLINSFELYLRDGNGYFYIDGSRKPDKDNPTLADRKADSAWMRFFTASQLINHRYKVINGKNTLVLATFESRVIEPDGEFGEKIVTKHLILTPGQFRTRTQNDKNEFVDVPEESGETGLDFIPVIPITEIGSVPPLLTLALLNRLYYNKVSDFDDWCHLAFVPQRVIKAQDKTQLNAIIEGMPTIGANVAIGLWGEGAEASFLEVTGNGIELAMKRNAELEAQMKSLGVGMLLPTEGAKSATEVIDTAGKRQSKLARYTRVFENAVEKALYALGQMLNAVKGANTVNLNESEVTSLRLKIDYDKLTLEPNELMFFSDMVEKGQLSNLTFLKWLQENHDMPEGFDPETEVQQISKMNSTIEVEAVEAA